jgi:hypothetical protein
MEFALHQGLKTMAEPGLSGFCPHCQAPVMAKCGSKKIWHWAHVAVESCDPWFEPETQWHRDWKNAFGKNQSEIRVEKQNKYHIADVINEAGIIFEFQNSPISADTIMAREKFYGERMIWVINGSAFKNNFHLRDQEFINQWQLKVMDEFEALKHYKAYESSLLIEDWKVKKEEVKDYLIQKNFNHVSEAGVYYLTLNTARNKDLLAEKLYAEIKELYEQQNTSIDFVKGEFEWEHARASWQESKRPVFIDFGEKYLYHVSSQPGRRYGRGVKVNKQRFLEKYAKASAPMIL